MGEVWAAYNEGLKTEVAVKFITGEDVANTRARVRFEREAEIAAKLKSPHVAHTYDHGCLDDGTPYIIMELMEGETLSERLRRGPLSMAEMSVVLRQAAKALGKAHKLGIVHRDVKPSNLFLIDEDDEPFVKLLDFGVARCSAVSGETKLTQMGHLLGTPLYMGPEQFAEPMNVDGSADLWSLAVTIYQCLAARPPFRGETTGVVLTAVVTRRYEPITKLRPELPAELDHWFERAFHNKVESRHKSAREMASSFAAIARKHGRGESAAASVLAEPRSGAELTGDKEILSEEGTLVMVDNTTIDLPRGWQPKVTNLPYSRSTANEATPSAAAGALPSTAANPAAANPQAAGPSPSAAVGSPSGAGPSPSAAVGSPSGAGPSPSAAVGSPLAAGPSPSAAVGSLAAAVGASSSAAATPSAASRPSAADIPPAAPSEPSPDVDMSSAGQRDSTVTTAARAKESHGGARRIVVAALAAVCIGLIGILIALESGRAEEPTPVVASNPEGVAVSDESEPDNSDKSPNPDLNSDRSPPEAPPTSSGPDNTTLPETPEKRSSPRTRHPVKSRPAPNKEDIYNLPEQSTNGGSKEDIY